MYFRYTLFLLLFVHIFSLNHGKHLKIISLNSQYDKPLNWSKYQYYIIASKNSENSAKIWSKKIIQHKKININKLCAIASVSSYYLKTPFSKLLIKNTLLLYQKEIPIYIDWNEKFSKLNNIESYPTIIIIHIENNNKYKIIKSISGEYSESKLADIFDL